MPVVQRERGMALRREHLVPPVDADRGVRVRGALHGGRAHGQYRGRGVRVVFPCDDREGRVEDQIAM